MPPPPSALNLMGSKGPLALCGEGPGGAAPLPCDPYAARATGRPPRSATKHSAATKQNTPAVKKAGR